MPSPSARSRTSAGSGASGVAVPARPSCPARSASSRSSIVRLRELRQVADEPRGQLPLRRAHHAPCHACSASLTTTTSRRSAGHLKQLRFRDGELISARARPGQQRDQLRRSAPAAPGGAGRSASGSTPRTVVLLHHPAPRRGGRAGPPGDDQPGHQPRRQRRRPVGRPRLQLLHHALRRAGVLRRAASTCTTSSRPGTAGVRSPSRRRVSPRSSPARTCATPAWPCGSDARRRQRCQRRRQATGDHHRRELRREVNLPA